MTNAVQATAAPAELRLAGKTYRMSPLTDGDLGELERHLQTRAFAVAKANLEGLSPEDRRTLLRVAYDTAYRVTLASPEASAFMRGLEGAAYLLWLGLRHNHPDLTPEAVRPMLTDERTVAEAMDRLDELNGTGPDEDDDAKKKATPPPTRAEKNRRGGRSTASPSTASSPSSTGGTPTP